MKRSMWKLMGLCVMICLAVGIYCMATAEEPEIVETEIETIYVQPRISQEQAEQEYLNGLFGLPVTPVEDLPRLRGTVSGSRFAEGSQEWKLYTALKSRIQQVAEGALASTEFEITTDEIDAMVFTRDNVNLAEGESVFDAEGQPSQAMKREIQNVLTPLASSVISAVSFDCPYEAFWRDSGSGCYGVGWSYTYSQSAERVTVKKLYIRIRVAEDYRGASSIYTINTDLIDSVHTAAATAQAIVSQNTGKGDYAKLTAYKQKICELTDYNYDAANDQYLYEYGNPWQLVWVFDGDPNTKVVCEGYSKAFQYLCDQSTWNGDVEVISVSGLMWNKTETDTGISWDPGAHMWNIVRMNGQNYMADITNSDDESVGQFGGLFLDGYDDTGTDSDGNTIYFYTTEGATIDNYTWFPWETGYSYNGNTTAAFEDNRLTPANTAAEPQPYLSVSKSKTVVGENVTITAGLPGAGHIRVKSLKDDFVNDQLTEIQAGDTGEWTVSFDEPGEYTLSMYGWSDERWNDSSILGDITQYPDIWGPTETETTVTVSYADFPESINPGEDAVITIAPIAGATEYNVSVQPWGSIIYEIDSPQAGTFVIPAMVFADGFEGAINVSACKETEEGSEDLFWDYHEYSVAAYTGADILTISAGTYHDGLLPINLSVTNAEQVIVQEVDYDNDGQVPVPYWTTICAADNPGAAVDVTPKTRKEHQIRAAVKQNGAWSAWSPVIEATTPIHGKCNENIEWTLSDDGNLTIYGTGEIPGTYEMPDPWNEYSEEITGIEIGNGITGIDNYTFAGLANLETVTIPASLTNLGEGAFCDCTSLESVVSSDPGAAMTTHTRCYDNAIKTFSLPATLPEAGIGYAAFAYTPAFGENSPLNPDFDIPMDTGTIEDDAFYGIDATHVRMTVYELENCTIGNNAFGRCTSLRYFQMDSWGERVNYTIADNAFDGCTNLIFIGEYNEYLKQYAVDHGFVYLENEGIWGNG